MGNKAYLRFKICCLLCVLVRRRATQKAKMHTTRPSSMTRANLNPARMEMWHHIKHTNNVCVRATTESGI